MELEKELELLDFLEMTEGHQTAAAYCYIFESQEFVNLSSTKGEDFNEIIKGMEELIEYREGREFFPLEMFNQLLKERAPHINTMVWAVFQDASTK